MKVEVRAVTGIEEAIKSLFLSKRTWNTDLDQEIERVVAAVTDRYGNRIEADPEDVEKYDKWMNTLFNVGKKHITLLRFINIHLMTVGMHRAGQDDIDSHARRFENKIIRSSTRLAKFDSGEMSDWYRDKIITDDQACIKLGIQLPDRFEDNGITYVKTPNGYVKEEYVNNKDVLRGLYMLSIPSNFVSQISLCEWAHVYQQRNRSGGANPEVKEWAEAVTIGIHSKIAQVTPEYLLEVNN